MDYHMGIDWAFIATPIFKFNPMEQLPSGRDSIEILCSFKFLVMKGFCYAKGGNQYFKRFVFYKYNWNLSGTY